MEQVGELAEQMEAQGMPPVLLVGSPLRQWLARLLRPSNTSLNVLAYEELPGSKRIKIIATVGQAVN